MTLQLRKGVQKVLQMEFENQEDLAPCLSFPGCLS